MKNWFTSSVLGLTLLATACGGGNNDPLSPELQAQATAELAAVVDDPARPLSSLSVLAVRSGKVVYEGQFGQRSVERALPANDQTLYRIASVSKLVTAVGFMKLVETGAINLDADVGNYLGFAVRNPAFPTQVITSRMLLSHTASIRDASDLIITQVGSTLEDALATLDPASGKPAFWAASATEAPDRRYFTYANYNTIVLATIIERVSGQRFDLYMKSAVLDPLGLRGGFVPSVNIDRADDINLATLYRKSPDGGSTWDAAGPWVPQGFDRSGVAPTPITNLADYVVGSNAGVFGPQGSLRMTARGLGSVMLMLMNQGSLDGVTVLRPATVALMMTPQWAYNDQPGAPNGDTYYDLFYAWGLGMQLFTDRGGSEASGDRVGSPGGGFRGAGHLGDAYGLLSGFMFDPANNNGMVYLIGGIGADPFDNLGSYSAFYRWEESILRTLYRRTILEASD
jgi:CubicO group peptidase (beta-lactamase class C family)